MKVCIPDYTSTWEIRADDCPIKSYKDDPQEWLITRNSHHQVLLPVRNLLLVEPSARGSSWRSVVGSAARLNASILPSTEQHLLSMITPLMFGQCMLEILPKSWKSYSHNMFIAFDWIAPCISQFLGTNTGVTRCVPNSQLRTPPGCLLPTINRNHVQKSLWRVRKSLTFSGKKQIKAGYQSCCLLHKHNGGIKIVNPHYRVCIICYVVQAQIELYTWRVLYA